MTNVVVSPVQHKVEVDEQTHQVIVRAPGIQGPQGPAGEPLLTYTHVQSVPSSEWEIVHNLGYLLNLTVIDSAGTQVEGEVTYVDLNTIRVTFNAGPFSGRAFLS